MISNHPIGIIRFLAQLRRVRNLCQLFRCPNQRQKQIRIIITALVLQNSRNALQTGAGIHIIGPQPLKHTIRPPIELNKNQIPQFNKPGAAAVDPAQMTAHIPHITPVRPQINMNFAARPARPACAHFPEIILATAEQNPLLWKRCNLPPKFR